MVVYTCIKNRFQLHSGSDQVGGAKLISLPSDQGQVNLAEQDDFPAASSAPSQEPPKHHLFLPPPTS